MSPTTLPQQPSPPQSERAALAMRAAGVGVFELDVAGARLMLTAAAASLFGFPNEDLDLSRREVFERINPEDHPILLGAGVDDPGGNFVARFRARLPGRGERWLLARGARFELGGRPTVLGLIQDIQREVELEEESAQFRGELARQRDELQAQGEQLQGLSTRVLAAQEEERRRISRELHDEIGQSLTACILNLEIAHATHPDAGLPDVVDDLRRVLSQIREMSLELRPPLLDRAGLKPALVWLVERVGAAGRLRVKLQADGLHERLDPRVEITAFRIVQEALTNIVRHARARRVDISLGCTAVELAIKISDDGVGFEVGDKHAAAAAGGSQGVLGMTERAHLVGGRTEVVSQAGVGSVVLARLPLQPSR